MSFEIRLSPDVSLKAMPSAGYSDPLIETSLEYKDL